MNLQDQLEQAEAAVAFLKKRIAIASCDEGGHQWNVLGHTNAGCSIDCICSIPVYECERCGGCDYGDNPEGKEVVAKCKATSNEAEE